MSDWEFHVNIANVGIESIKSLFTLADKYLNNMLLRFEQNLYRSDNVTNKLKSMQIGLVPNSYEPNQFTLHSMWLIMYSCGHISGPHERIRIKFGVLGFFIIIMIYWNIRMKMLKCKNESLMTSHFGTLWSKLYKFLKTFWKSVDAIFKDVSVTTHKKFDAKFLI